MQVASHLAARPSDVGIDLDAHAVHGSEHGSDALPGCTLRAVSTAVRQVGRYKIYLSTASTGIFYEVGDYAGNGQDHCGLVNPAFRIPNEDDITSGGCPRCAIDSLHVFSPPVGSQGWSRATFG